MGVIGLRNAAPLYVVTPTARARVARVAESVIMSRDEHATRRASNCPINREWKGEEGEEEWKVGSRGLLLGGIL